MRPDLVSLIVFAGAFGGALVGMSLRLLIPPGHLSSESKDTVKLGMGLVATMTALLLSLLIATAKSSYDNERNDLTQMAAKIIFLDRVLNNYGEESAQVRRLLRSSVAASIDSLWPRDGRQPSVADVSASGSLAVFDAIADLDPQTEVQRSLKAEASRIALDLGQTRWLMLEQAGGSISRPFLVVTILWLTLIFISFGLFAPSNGTVFGTLLMCSMVVASAFFIVLELDHPYEGVIQISSQPMRHAHAVIGQ